jgi:hypothetical protein
MSHKSVVARSVISIIFYFFIFCVLLFGVVNWIEPVKASPNSGIKEGCEAIGTIGVIIVARCYDEETNSVFYGNSAGWMSGPIDY